MSLNWPNDIKLSQPQIGSFLALWVSGYGAVQALAPMITGEKAGAVPTADKYRYAIQLCISVGIDRWPDGIRCCDVKSRRMNILSPKSGAGSSQTCRW
jgi:hypothetical protein